VKIAFKINTKSDIPRFYFKVQIVFLSPQGQFRTFTFEIRISILGQMVTLLIHAGLQQQQQLMEILAVQMTLT